MNVLMERFMFENITNSVRKCNLNIDEDQILILLKINYNIVMDSLQ